MPYLMKCFLISLTVQPDDIPWSKSIIVKLEKISTQARYFLPSSVMVSRTIRWNGYSGIGLVIRILCQGHVSCCYQLLNSLCVPFSSCYFSLKSVQRLSL